MLILFVCLSNDSCDTKIEVLHLVNIILCVTLAINIDIIDGCGLSNKVCCELVSKKTKAFNSQVACN